MTWTTFGPLVTPIATSALDDNFYDTFLGGSFLCTISGTDALALTYDTTLAPSIPEFSSGMTFYGIAAATNTTAVTVAVGSNPPLPVFKDTSAGPVVLTGGEIVANCACWFKYDATLGAGGGFHLMTGGAILNGQTINPGAVKIGTGTTLKKLITGQVTVTFTVCLANTTQDQNASLAGIVAGDNIIATPPASVISGVVYSAYVPAAGTVTVRAANVTAASLTPTGGTFRLTGLGF